MPESYDLSEPELALEQQLTAVLTLPAPPAGMDDRILAAARARAAAITTAASEGAAEADLVDQTVEQAVEHTVVEVPAGRLLRVLRFVRPLAAAACLLLAGTVAVSLTTPGTHHLATVSEADLSLSALGAARVIDAEGALGDGARAKLAESWVAEGEPLHVRPGGFLELELACGTRLVLDGGSSGHLRFDRTARRLHLDRGRVYADVVKVGLEDDRPLVVHAPGGVTRVLGTQLVVKAAAARSRVTVREGVVELINQHGSSRVPAGSSGLLSNDAAPLTRELASVERHFRWMGRIQRGPRHPSEKPFGGVAGDDEPAIGTLTAQVRGQPVHLTLAQQTITTEVADGLANTTVELLFKNDLPTRLEGQFRFALPRGADLARYAVEQGGSLREGVVVEREQARRIYREQKQEQRKTGLLEWNQGSAFTARVFPIEPRATKRIVIGFTSELSERDGVSRFVIPLVSETALAHPPERLVLRVRLGGPEASAPLRCPSHRVLRRFHDGAQELLLEAEGLQPRNDFVLELAQPEPLAVEARVEETPGEPDALLVRVRPPFGGGERRWADGPLVVLCDASASQAGTLKEVQLELLEGLLKRVANPRDVSVYLGHVDAVELKPSEAGPRADGLLSALWRAETGGALDLSRCLDTLGRRLARDAGATLVVLSDGNASVGRRAPHQIVNALRRLPTEQVRRVVTVGLGTALNGNVLRGMASARGGVFVTVRPGDDLSRKLDEVVSAVGEPVLTDLSVWLDVPGVIAQAPRRLQNLRQGETLTLGARRTGSAASGFVEVRGLLSGRPYRFRAPLQITPVGQGETLARRWARRRIDELTLQGPQTADEVLDLGLRYGIVTSRTSLLVLEPDQLQRYRLKRKQTVTAQAQALVAQAAQVRHAAQARHLLLRAVVKDPGNALARKLLDSPLELQNARPLQIARLESAKGQIEGRIRKLVKKTPPTQNWRTRTGQVEQPVIVLEEEVEATTAVPKGTDLSRLSNKDLVTTVDQLKGLSPEQKRRLLKTVREYRHPLNETKKRVEKQQHQQQQRQRPRRMKKLQKMRERERRLPEMRKQLAKLGDEQEESEEGRGLVKERLARRLERIRPRERREAEKLLERVERDDDKRKLELGDARDRTLDGERRRSESASEAKKIHVKDDYGVSGGGGGGGRIVGGVAVDLKEFPGVVTRPQYSISRRKDNAKAPSGYDLWSSGPNQGKADGWGEGSKRKQVPGQKAQQAAARAYFAAARGASGLAGRGAEGEPAAIGALKTIGTSQSLFREGDKDGDVTLDYGSLTELADQALIDSVLGSRNTDLAAGFQLAIAKEPVPGSGEALLRAGRRLAAARAFSAAVEDNPDSAQAHHDYAKALQRCGLYVAALTEFAEAARLDPRPARLLTLAWEVRLRGNPRAAERILVRLLRGKLDAASAKRAKELLRGLYQAELKRGSRRAALLRTWIAALR